MADKSLSIAELADKAQRPISNEPAAGSALTMPVPPSPSEEASLLAVIQQAVRDPAIDVEKMERMMMLYERVEKRHAEQEFNIAMSAAQEEMRPIRADASNPQTKSKYASYPALDRVLRPIYTRHGFALSFDTGDAPAPEMVRVLCYASHIGGYSRTYKIDMPADGKGAKGGDVMTKTHATGSAVTYGQRYLLKSIFNIAVGDDDDGNAAGDGSEKIDASQVQHVRDLIESQGADVEKFCKYFKIGAVPDLKQKDYEKAISMLNLRSKDTAK